MEDRSAGGETKSRGLRRCPVHPLLPHATAGHPAGIKHYVPFSILPCEGARQHNAVPVGCSEPMSHRRARSREPHPQRACGDGHRDLQGTHLCPAAQEQVCFSGRNKGQNQAQRIVCGFWSDPKAPSQVRTTGAICKILQPRGALFPLAFISIFKLPSVTAKTVRAKILHAVYQGA